MNDRSQKYEITISYLEKIKGELRIIQSCEHAHVYSLVPHTKNYKKIQILLASNPMGGGKTHTDPREVSELFSTHYSAIAPILDIAKLYLTQAYCGSKASRFLYKPP